MEAERLTAVCGLYCGACGIYRAGHDNNQERLEKIRQLMSSRRQVTLDGLQCDGCLAQDRLAPHCRECKIRLCARDKPGVTHCSDCPDFPCVRITVFNGDGVRHHAEVLENIRRQQEIGIKAWLKEQEERWRCLHCQAPVEWYARLCFQCKTPQPRRLPALPADKK